MLLAQPWWTLPCSLTLLANGNPLAMSHSSCLQTKFQKTTGNVYAIIIHDLYARMVTSCAMSALATSPTMGRNFILKHIGPHILSVAQMAPSFSSALPRLSLARWKKTWNNVETMEHFGSRNVKSNKINLIE